MEERRSTLVISAHRLIHRKPRAADTLRSAPPRAAVVLDRTGHPHAHDESADSGDLVDDTRPAPPHPHRRCGAMLLGSLFSGDGGLN